MDNLVIIAIIAAIVGLAALYVYKAKKSGKKCIGCPDGGCSCGSDKNESDCSCCCGKH